MKQSLEVLISALNKDAAKLVSGMGLECDAVVVDQTDRDAESSFELENGYSVHASRSTRSGCSAERTASPKASRSVRWRGIRRGPWISSKSNGPP